ncbi:MAG: hypothetical protein LBS68_03305 [Puniceicoccales bacterium]|jgi:hypothetical protein|nr:hypothetical protein [Puniceicoccales bacterium]
MAGSVGGKKFLISVFIQGGKWTNESVKCLEKMGFSQEISIGGNLHPIPEHVFAKYDGGKNLEKTRDEILDKVERTIKKGSGTKVYVVITDDLVPLLIGDGST